MQVNLLLFLTLTKHLYCMFQLLQQKVRLNCLLEINGYTNEPFGVFGQNVFLSY